MCVKWIRPGNVFFDCLGPLVSLPTPSGENICTIYKGLPLQTESLDWAAASEIYRWDATNWQPIGRRLWKHVEQKAPFFKRNAEKFSVKLQATFHRLHFRCLLIVNFKSNSNDFKLCSLTAISPSVPYDKDLHKICRIVNSVADKYLLATCYLVERNNVFVKGGFNWLSRS